MAFDTGFGGLWTSTDGCVQGIFLQRHRDTKAAKTFLTDSWLNTMSQR